MSVKMGWAEVDITPDGPVDLSGQFYHRPSRGVHSRLAATALALESEAGVQAVMVSIDSVGVDKDLLDDLRNRLDAPGLDGGAVMLNAIHTHTAPGVRPPARYCPWLEDVPDLVPPEVYREFLLVRLARVVVEAWHARAPGGVASVLGAARVGHCRRAVYRDGTAEMYGRTDRPDFVGMEGGEDSGVDLLYTFGEAGRLTGVVVNLACPSQVMESMYVISSDYLGEVRRLMQARFGDTVRVLGQISAAGCQSPRDLVRNYRGEPDFWHADGVAELGRRVAATVMANVESAMAGRIGNPVFRTHVETVRLPVRRVSAADVARARQDLETLQARISETDAYRAFCEQTRDNECVPGRPGPYDDKEHPFSLMQNAKAILARETSQRESPEYAFECHVIRIGDTVLVSNPFELFLDYGQQIKARSPARQTFVIQLACDTCGYLPTARAEAHGGYGGMVVNGRVGSEGGAMLVEKTLAAIHRVMREPAPAEG